MNMPAAGLLETLAGTAKATRFRAGTPIYHQGQSLASVYLIVQGYVRLAAASRSGEERTRAILGPGALFGASLGADGSVSADTTAFALGPLRLCSVPQRQLRELAERQPALGWSLVQHLAAANATLERRLQMLCDGSVEVRLAGLLLDLLLQYGAHCRHGHSVDIRISHQDLADLIGASRPVVSALLAEFRRRGSIGYTRRYICIDDPEALRRLAEA